MHYFDAKTKQRILYCVSKNVFLFFNFPGNFISNVLANKANVYMVAGLQERYKQVLGWDLTAGSINSKVHANRLRSIIIDTRRKADCKITALSMDQGTVNQGC